MIWIIPYYSLHFATPLYYYTLYSALYSTLFSTLYYSELYYTILYDATLTTCTMIIHQECIIRYCTTNIIFYVIQCNKLDYSILSLHFRTYSTLLYYYTLYSALHSTLLFSISYYSVLYYTILYDNILTTCTIIHPDCIILQCTTILLYYSVLLYYSLFYAVAGYILLY